MSTKDTLCQPSEQAQRTKGAIVACSRGDNRELPDRERGPRPQRPDSVAHLDDFERSCALPALRDVILPLSVLPRIDCVLQPSKERVLEVNAR